MRAACMVMVAALGFLGAHPVEARTLDGQRNLFELGGIVGATYHPPPNLLFGGEAGRRLEPVAAQVGLRLSYLPVGGFGLELEAALMPTSTPGGQWAVLSAVRAHAILQLPLSYGLVPFLVLGGGCLAVGSNDEVGVGDDVDGALHYGVGLKYYINQTLMVRLDLRHSIHARLLDDQIGHRFEILAGFSYVFGHKTAAQRADADGDGVVDGRDKCPKVAARNPTGCPTDGDADGVPDDKDKCPKVAAKTPTGCPVVKTPDATVTDADGDGVVDARDKCPQVAAKSADGCPADHDADGVPDSKDKCPLVAAKTADGCPADSDGDGLSDSRDKCPKKGETRNGFRDSDGCPDQIPRDLGRILGVVRGVGFKKKKTTLRRRSGRKLKRLAAVLSRYKSVRVRVVVHTDSRGDSESNLAVTLKQARVIQAQLVRLGVAAPRIEVKGVGALEPRAKNRTRAGRAKNRRVEIKIIVRK